jgi:hypothetical protein
MRKIADRWRRSHWRSHLVAVSRKSCLLLIDTRPCAQRLLVKLAGSERRLYELCDKALDMAAILKAAGGEITEREAGALLGSLTERRLMLRVGGRYLSLATRAAAGRSAERKGCDEKMPGGHMRPMAPWDLLAAWRRRTGFRWVLSAYLHREMALASLKLGNRLATRLLSAFVHGAARLVSRLDAPSR